jgi:hypothetical protein
LISHFSAAVKEKKMEKRGGKIESEDFSPHGMGKESNMIPFFLDKQMRSG